MPFPPPTTAPGAAAVPTRDVGRDGGTRSAQAPPPWVVMGQLLSGYAVSQLIHVAVRLGLPELLAEGPRSAGELAAATSSEPRALLRLLRGLAVVGLMAADGEERFGLTALGRSLQRRTPGSLRALALLTEESYRAWGDLLYSVRTGRTAFDRVFGVGRFEYLARNAEAATVFDEAMAGMSVAFARSVPAAVDFPETGTLVDVGGGSGELLKAILSSRPKVRGVLFDRPEVVERARGGIEAAGLAARVELRGGDFLESVPAGGDSYILSHVLHNWDDDRARRVLGNCRKALREEARLLIVEMVIPSPPNLTRESYLPAMTDLQMMVMTGGQERSEDEWRRLLASSGFEAVRLVPLEGCHCILEARPAG